MTNPDKESYQSILLSDDVLGFSLEPIVGFISIISKRVSLYTGWSALFLFYFIHLFLMYFLIFSSFKNIFEGKIFISIFALVFLILTYGILHSFIQIRFGLANSLVLYVFSLLFSRSSYFKKIFFGGLAIFTHYSSILAVFSLFVIEFRKVQYNLNSYKLIHIGFVVILMLFNLGSIFNVLPEFLLGRIVGYLDNNMIDKTSIQSIYMSLIYYLILILSPKFNNFKLDSLRFYGALGFLPYFIVPDIEILVRLGIAFQYLLLPYLILTARYKKVLFFSTIPLSIFFLYKFYSGINSLIEYSLL